MNVTPHSKIRVILTGATGMVGEGVLHECLQHNEVEQILVISRRTCGIKHPKLKEIIHSDFYNISPIENELQGYNACFFCLGITAIGINEKEYTKVTYTLTLHFAGVLSRKNNDMILCYVSSVGTDSTEKGNAMWARVNGKTENALMKLPFKKVFNFRPGYMQPDKELKNTKNYYKYISWLYPVLRPLFSKYVSTLSEVGLAMINAVTKGYEKQILEVKDIVALAKE